MKILVTGSAGHLGEALVRSLRQHDEHEVVGTDVVESAFTSLVGSVADREHVQRCLQQQNVDAVIHTAGLHKPHVATHSKQEFIETNVTGTLILLEEAVAAGTVKAFVMTSTTSLFGDAMTPAAPDAPAVWITEDVVPIPKNIYGVTKLAAESMCQLFSRNHGLPCIVLRTSRFFPETDDMKEVRDAFDDDNSKANEFLHRRVDIEDVVSAHLVAIQKARTTGGYCCYIVSATTPFTRVDCMELRTDASAVLERRATADYKAQYAKLGWRMFSSISRVYDNARARQELGWIPRHSFDSIMERLEVTSAGDGSVLSPLANQVGSKGYHGDKKTFGDVGPYPV